MNFQHIVETYLMLPMMLIGLIMLIYGLLLEIKDIIKNYKLKNMKEIIQKQLENEGFKIEDKGYYEVKNSFYNQLMASVQIHKDIYLFPMELSNTIIPILKLPFRMGKLVIQTGKEIIK